MVDKGIVLETIKKMYASGLSDSVIESTLKDIGLSAEEIRATMNEAKGISKPDEQREAPESAVENAPEEELHEKIASKTAAKLKQHLEEKSEDDALAHNATNVALAGHDLKLEEISSRLESIERKIGAISLSGLSDFSSRAVSLDKKISAIESDLAEVKALSNALKSLLEKVLDTDRSVLAELEEKK